MGNGAKFQRVFLIHLLHCAAIVNHIAGGQPPQTVTVHGVDDKIPQKSGAGETSFVL